MRSENRCRWGMIASVPTLSCRKMLGESGATFEEPAEHRQRDAALRLLLVVALVALLRQAVDLEAARMARAHDAVLENEVLQLERLRATDPARARSAPDRSRLQPAPSRPLRHAACISARSRRTRYTQKRIAECRGVIRSISGSDGSKQTVIGTRAANQNGYPRKACTFSSRNRLGTKRSHPGRRCTLGLRSSEQNDQ